MTDSASSSPHHRDKDKHHINQPNHHHQDDSPFSLANLRRHFEACYSAREDGELDMDAYVAGYDEIYKFLNLMGTVFGWVASDVGHKNDVLRRCRQGDQRESYVTVQAMVQHEIGNQTVNANKHHKDCTSGARNLLRLHRALAYVAAFLEGLPGLADADKCCPHSQAAYKRTLAKHHPWAVQKAALLAMNLLPTKEGLIHKICGESVGEYESALTALPAVVAALKEVYDRTQKIYEEHNLLDLP